MSKKPKLPTWVDPLEDEIPQTAFYLQPSHQEQYSARIQFLLVVSWSLLGVQSIFQSLGWIRHHQHRMTFDSDADVVYHPPTISMTMYLQYSEQLQVLVPILNLFVF